MKTSTVKCIAKFPRNFSHSDTFGHIFQDTRHSMSPPIVSSRGVSSSHFRSLTVEYVYGDRFRLSITGVTSVPSRVRRLRLLHQEKTRRAVTLLRDHGDAASVRVVADYL